MILMSFQFLEDFIKSVTEKILNAHGKEITWLHQQLKYQVSNDLLELV